MKIRNLITNQKKMEKNGKTQNNDLFISLKRKNTILEIGLKSFILSKHDY